MKTYSIEITRIRFYRDNKSRVVTGTLTELVEYFSYDLERGDS